jgi:ssDNA-binding Zn-finger/Zn-ribbon topoisomerase 1
MKDVNCPYCDAELEINHDDGNGCHEDRIYTQECPECEDYHEDDGMGNSVCPDCGSDLVNGKEGEG